jgi:hypothetical protein
MFAPKSYIWSIFLNGGINISYDYDEGQWQQVTKHKVCGFKIHDKINATDVILHEIEKDHLSTDIDKLNPLHIVSKFKVLSLVHSDQATEVHTACASGQSTQKFVRRSHAMETVLVISGESLKRPLFVVAEVIEVILLVPKRVIMAWITAIGLLKIVMPPHALALGILTFTPLLHQFDLFLLGDAGLTLVYFV